MIFEMDVPIEKWAEQVRAGDIGSISRAISAVESGAPSSEKLLQILFPVTGNAFQIGLTGAPGTGKSTLVDCLTGLYRDEKQKVGILAVDPSSPFTGGAILGDRVRMQSHAADPDVYVRSIATRGHLGGLADAVGDAALLLDAAGKDIILIETAGVGQSEVEVARLADCTVVVLMPGQGDEIQNLKAGVMEIGDIFVLNKSDYDEAAHYEQQIRGILELAPGRDGWRPPLVCTVATENKGIEDLKRNINIFREHRDQSSGRQSREIERWKDRIQRALQARLMEKIAKSFGPNELEEVAAAIAARKKDPLRAISEIAARALP